MSSRTIDVGIDLGTSNSTAAVARDGRAVIVRSSSDDQLTPSVVRYLRNGSVQVGRKAYEHFRLSDDGSAFARFKREMGLQRRFPVPTTGAEVSPEDLSAEVLKSLRGDVERFLDTPIDAAVITVPANFELVQCEATQRAAATAGIAHSVLLQEPIAAGLAYGYDRDLTDAYFVVYDLGGGTFDLTLMRVAEGRLTIVDTAGDNYQGGRDWDRRLSGLIAQRLIDAGFDLWPRDDPAGREFVARLDLFAEQEKIRLSQLDQVEVFFDGELADRAGTPIEATIPIGRAEYEQLIASDIERTVNLLQGMLLRQNLPPSAVARIVLVGGPTRTPLLRRMVTTLSDIAIDTEIDPMTVVAAGAATFAATQVREASTTHVPATGNVTLTLSFKSATDDEIAHVGGRIAAGTHDIAAVELARDDGGWSSGRIPTQGGTFFTTVSLVPRRSNTFSIACLDATGRVVPAEPQSITIVQGMVVGDPQLTRPILIEALNDRDEPESVVILHRAAPLPAVGRKRFLSLREVQPGDASDALAIDVYEGDYERAQLNRHVGTLSIPGSRLTRPLPRHTPIEITLRVDASRTASVSAYVPLLDQTFDGVLTNRIMLEEDPAEVRRQLEIEVGRLARLTQLAPRKVEDLQQLAEEIRTDLDEAAGGDSERAVRAARRQRDLANAVDRMHAELAIELKGQDLTWALTWTDQRIQAFGTDGHAARLAQLHREAESAVLTQDPQAMDAVYAKVVALYQEVTWDQPAFWSAELLALMARAEERGVPVPQELLARGRRAIELQDIDALRQAYWDLDRLAPSSEDGRAANPIDIRRA